VKSLELQHPCKRLRHPLVVVHDEDGRVVDSDMAVGT
jgi:hypothetical protein